jgi:hypothetical protein
MLKGLLFALAIVYPLSTSAQTEPQFPTEGEITTLMAQANLAMKQYQQTMNVETANLGKDAETKKVEKNAIENWDYIASVMKAKPDNFNSGAGFFLVELINTAYESALSCEVSAQGAYATATILKNDNVANAAREVSQNCLSTAQLLVVVKLSATNLYTKYLQAHKIMYDKTFAVAADCTEAMERSRAKKP